MSENNSNVRKLRIVGTGLVIGGTAIMVLGARKKFGVIIESAKEAGVNEWLREMHDNKLTVMVLTQELAEKVFTAANAAADDIGIVVSPS